MHACLGSVYCFVGKYRVLPACLRGGAGAVCLVGDTAAAADVFFESQSLLGDNETVFGISEAESKYLGSCLLYCGACSTLRGSSSLDLGQTDRELVKGKWTDVFNYTVHAFFYARRPCVVVPRYYSYEGLCSKCMYVGDTQTGSVSGNF